MRKKMKFGPNAKDAILNPVGSMLCAGIGQTLANITQKMDHPSLYWGKFEEVIEHLVSKEEAIDLLQLSQTASGLTEFIRGGVLSKIKEEGWYAPYNSFADFCQHECDFRVRKAEFLIQIYKAITGAQIPPNKLLDIHWTKLRLIIRKNVIDDIFEWLPKAKTMTVKELSAAIETENAPVSEDTEKKVALPVKAYPEQLENINNAISFCKEIYNVNHDNEALACICLEFLGTHGKSPKPMTTNITGLCHGAMDENDGDEHLALLEIINQMEAVFPNWSISVSQKQPIIYKTT